MEHINMKEYRCSCGKLLFKASLQSAILEVKCKKCHEIICFSASEIGEKKEVVSPASNHYKDTRQPTVQLA